MKLWPGFRATFILLALLHGFIAPAGAQDVPQVRLEGSFEVHPSNEALFNSPLFSFNNDIYVAFIDPDLNTAVAQKRKGQWRTVIIDTMTQDDKWHNAPSLALDANGYVHALYNMHSTPWQYKVSSLPENLSSWEFRGQDAGMIPGKTTPSEALCFDGCADAWDGPGIAAIPGNQITYPFMTTDRNGVVYVAFRECLDCASSDYFARKWSGGIARYDQATKTWERVGGIRPWATDVDYVPLGIRLYFDYANRMHVSWVWYKHYVADGSSHFAPNYPSYAFSDDGGESFFKANGNALSLPIDFAQSDLLLDPGWVDPHDDGYFYGNTEIATLAEGRPLVVIYPKTTSSSVRTSYVTFNASEGWSAPRATPWNATRIFVTADGVMNALSSGVRWHRSVDGGVTWGITEIAVEEGPYSTVPDYSYFAATGRMRFLTMSSASGGAIMKIWTAGMALPDESPPAAPMGVHVER